MSRDRVAEAALDEVVLDRLRLCPAEVDFFELAKILNVTPGSRHWARLQGSLHRLEDAGLAEVLRRRGELAAYWRPTVPTDEVTPVDLDAIGGAA